MIFPIADFFIKPFAPTNALRRMRKALQVERRSEGASIQRSLEAHSPDPSALSR
jgi:hypothetical protein